MGLLSKIGAWFKRTFGRSAPPQASEYRKATQAEKVTLGKANVKGSIYVPVKNKRITKRTKSLSRRELARVKHGGLTNEEFAKTRKPIIKPLSNGKREAFYQMPSDRVGFDTRLIQIMKEWPASGEPRASVLVMYSGNTHPVASPMLFLHEMSPAEIKASNAAADAEGEEDEDGDASGSLIWREVEGDALKKYRGNKASIATVTLRVVGN